MGLFRGEDLNIGDSISGAWFSEDGRFRFALWRIWNRDLPMLIFTGLNPSKAGRFNNDPTIVRLIDFGKIWGFGGLFASNLHPYITPYPKELWPHAAEQQELNDAAIKQMRALSGTAFVGWGNEGIHAGDRATRVLELLGEPVYCLKVNKSGEPIHPLYLPKTSRLIPYIRKEFDGQKS